MQTNFLWHSSLTLLVVSHSVVDSSLIDLECRLQLPCAVRTSEFGNRSLSLSKTRMLKQLPKNSLNEYFPSVSGSLRLSEQKISRWVSFSQWSSYVDIVTRRTGRTYSTHFVGGCVCVTSHHHYATLAQNFMSKTSETKNYSHNNFITETKWTLTVFLNTKIATKTRTYIKRSICETKLAH